jgi:two-component system, chemotaxis family, chemotaxis protein CheY
MQTCLVVEDSKIVRKMSTGMVRELGFSVDEAEDGLVAQDKVLGDMPDLILLDWHMPNMNGIEFLTWLRSEAPNGDHPIVIFCTAETDMVHIQEALMAGANEYVMKPFDADILRSKLELLGVL